MRILWHSVAPWAPTGYGRQTATFARRFRDAGHEVILSAEWGLSGAPLEWEGIQIYPSDEKFGNQLLPEIAKRHHSCTVITLFDAWVFDPRAMGQIPELACWTPIDHEPVPPRVAQFLRASGARPIAMSQFGTQQLHQAGLDPLYVPHGIDTNVFKPHDDRLELREQMHFPKDAFVVGVVANNMGRTPPRKAFPQILMAFTEFRNRHDDVFLFLHTNLAGARVHRGMDIPRFCDLIGLPITSIGFTPQFELEIGVVEDRHLAQLYSTFDVLLNPSYGEGFGIPIVEAQACGTPVIVTDWTSMPELCGAGWMVQGDPSWDEDHGAFFMAPSIQEIVDALEKAYARRGDQEVRDHARAFALGYDADKVMAEHWAPALEKLAKPREIPPLLRPVGNREQRRAAAKVKA